MVSALKAGQRAVTAPPPGGGGGGTMLGHGPLLDGHESDRDRERHKRDFVLTGLSVGRLYIIVTRLGQRAEVTEMDTDQEVSW